MIAVVQRVRQASVEIGGELHAKIGKGLLVLLGIAQSDTTTDAEWLAGKIAQMRIFADAEGKMNLSVVQTGGGALVVSQFTLLADARKGNRPSFIAAARPEQAIPLYEAFVAEMTRFVPTQTGVFGADMQISLVNDGPVTIVLDTKTIT